MWHVITVFKRNFFKQESDIIYLRESCHERRTEAR